MSYNLLAESIGQIPWEALHRRLKPELRNVEVFPIPASKASASDAIGLSILAKGASEEGFQEACRIVEILRREFGMTVVDLHTSMELSPSKTTDFRNSLLG